MCDKVKIKNNGDWICPKCESRNSEHKDNIKKINKVLCNSCYSEFELDKDTGNSLDIEKLKQANSNIEHLINRILQSEMEAKESYCYFPRERYDEKWNCDNLKCSDCRKKYYNNMKTELYKEYIVK